MRWERLTPGPDERVDFLEVIYEPSGHSTDARRPLRHDGHEYGLITSGILHASVGFDTFELRPGDSIAFDSAVPHLYWNATGQDVHAIWAVVHGQPGPRLTGRSLAGRLARAPGLVRIASGGLGRTRLPVRRPDRHLRRRPVLRPGARPEAGGRSRKRARAYAAAS